MNAAKAQGATREVRGRGPLLAGATVVFSMLWAAYTATTKLHELLVGAVVVILTVLFFFHLLRTEELKLNVQLRDLAQLWPIPWYLLSGCWTITRVLFEDLSGRRAGSFYRTCGFKTSRHDPTLLSRTALAVTYTSVTPNFIVIGVDPAQSLMFFFQLKRTPVPKMTRALGAQA